MHFAFILRLDAGQVEVIMAVGGDKGYLFHGSSSV